MPWPAIFSAAILIDALVFFLPLFRLRRLAPAPGCGGPLGIGDLSGGSGGGGAGGAFCSGCAFGCALRLASAIATSHSGMTGGCHSSYTPCCDWHGGSTPVLCLPVAGSAFWWLWGSVGLCTSRACVVSFGLTGGCSPPGWFGPSALRAWARISTPACCVVSFGLAGGCSPPGWFGPSALRAWVRVSAPACCFSGSVARDPSSTPRDDPSPLVRARSSRLVSGRLATRSPPAERSSLGTREPAVELSPPRTADDVCREPGIAPLKYDSSRFI